MYNDLVDVAWRAFVEIYEPYPSVVAMGAIQRAFIWFRFRFFACRLSVQFSSASAVFFPCTHFGGYSAPLPLSYSICLLFCCSLTCDANANVAAAAYVAHILCDCHWVRGWDLNESASEPCFSCCCCCFSFFSDAHWNATTSRHQQARERGRGERETGQVSTVVEVSYSFDCLPNCRVSSHKPSLCAYSSSLSPTLSHAWDITYNCV